MRIYDPRMGKFLSVDPITQKYPMLSPYQFAGNRPIVAVDLDGLEPKDVNTGKTLPAPANNSNYKSWGDLLTMSNDFSVMEKANNRFIMHTFSQQPLSAASSDELNIDYYSIKINKLPPSYKTAESFFEAIRTNFADYMKGGGASLKPYNSDESVLWQSANPTSSIMTFRIKPQLGGLTSLDDADVITEKYSKKDMYWIFKPVYDAAPLAPSDAGHPVSGQRQFGLTKNDDGSYTFYARGTDRPTNRVDSKMSSMVFSGADDLWKAVMKNISTKINQSGGAASENKEVSKRVSYSNDVSSEDKTKIRNGGN